MQKSLLVALMTLAAVTVMMLVPNEAEAKRRIIFYQSGEDIFVSGPLPAPFDADKKLTGAQAGYKCQVFGLFWAYMHTWNCQAVAVRGNQFFNDSKLTAAIDAKYDGDKNMGLWQQHGRWALVGVLLVGLVGFILKKSKRKRAAESEAEAYAR